MNACPFRPLQVIGQQTLTASGSAQGFTLSNAIKNFGPAGQIATTSRKATHAFVTVEDHPVRWSVSGTPTASTDGHEYKADTSFWLCSDEQIERFLVINSTGSNAVIHATFFSE